MDNLLKEVRRVQRRLALQRFLGLLGWCWFVAVLSAGVVIGTARFYPLNIVDWQWLAGFLAAGLAAAVAWTLLAGTPALQAALEIDQRFGLKQRVSSTLAMHLADRATAAGQALIADTDARLRRIAVLEKFPLRPPRHLLLPLLPALLLVAVVLFLPPVKENEAEAALAAAAQPPPLEVKRSAEDLRQKLVERRKQAEKEGLKDATELLKRLEEGTKELQTQTQREKALVKLNDLARELQQRRKQLGGGEALKRQMEKVQDVTRGPADELAKALSKSDFQKAAQALEKLQKELAQSRLDSAKKEELAKQLEQLKQKIDQLAQQAKADQADLQKRADQMKQAGDAAAAGKLEDEIQKLQQQGPHMEALQNLADKLGRCSKQIGQGQDVQAAEAMQEALQQMQDMARQQGELKTLEGAMEQLAAARRQINGDSCNGNGEGMLAGGGEGDKNGKPGPGLGKGLGNGARPEAKTNGTFFDSRVQRTVGKGAAQITGLTGGPNLKNQAEAEIQKAAVEIEHGSTDPLSGQRLPKKQSEHARQYFDSFREGK